MKHIPRKRFGQNFLINQQVIHDIISAVDPKPNQTLVEIGPGLGALTFPLLDRIEHLHVVELDRDLVARLRKQAKLSVHESDALKFDFSALKEADKPLRIVGNLPYNISSPLLFHLASFAHLVEDQHFMLQREVVERMVAEPGNKEYSRLSVMLQVRYDMDSLLDVPPDSFDPPPKVDSAVVRMLPKPLDQLKVKDQAIFAEVVAAAFSQRRKMLRNTLAAYAERIDFAALQFDLTRRAEDVPVDEYVMLANLLVAQA